MSNYANARSRLHDATANHRKVLAEYTAARDVIANELRGTKSALNESDKATLQQRMMEQHGDLMNWLEQTERELEAARLHFDIADDKAKDARRERDFQTALLWQTISERLYDAAMKQYAAARLIADENPPY